MENTIRGEDSLSSSSSDQATNCKGWERFLPKRPLRVLLVEDDSSTRQVVCALLSKCGYEVSCATDGSEAWNLLEQSKQTFDLVLADAVMPVLSGTDLLVKIMSSEAHRDIPVIMMSAQDSLEMVFKCLLKGAKDFLVKPLRKNELRNLWQHVWRRNHASGGSGSQGDAQGKKRKASRNLSSGDISNDNFSVSSGIDDKSVREDERAAQCPGGRQSDIKAKPSCPKVEGNQVSRAQRTVQRDEHLPSQEQRAELPIALEASEALGTSAKAIDFFGTTKTEPVTEHVCPRVNLEKETMALSQNCQALELTLKRTSSTGEGGTDQAGKQSVRRSNCSAFSKYTSNISSTQPVCVARSANEQGTYDCGLTGSTPPSIDGHRASLENCGKVNDRTTTTLHFPKATHFQHGMQIGSSPLYRLPSCCDEDSKQVQDNFLSNFRSPNSSTSNNLRPPHKESVPLGSEQLRRLELQKDVHGSGSMWCSNGSDKEDLGSSNGKLGQLLSSSDPDCMGTNADRYAVYERSNKPPDAEGVANAKPDTSMHEMPAYTLLSGRGSNDFSDRGSNMLEENMTGRSGDCAAAQDGHSLSGWHANEGGRMDMGRSGVHAFDKLNAPDQRPSVYDYRSSIREAALLKFREKRKMRCFEKKVRYQSRKKLAEQRPRVKGQFVRRAAAEVNTTT